MPRVRSLSGRRALPLAYTQADFCNLTLQDFKVKHAYIHIPTTKVNLYWETQIGIAQICLENKISKQLTQAHWLVSKAKYLTEAGIKCQPMS